MSGGPSHRSSDPRRMTVETVTMMCCRDERAHEVPDTELAALRPDGHFQALCGHMIAAAPMVMPDGEPCQLCGAIRDRNTTPPRRAARLQRILG